MMGFSCRSENTAQALMKHNCNRLYQVFGTGWNWFLPNSVAYVIGWASNVPHLEDIQEL